MTDLSALLHRNLLEVFGERDEAARLAVLREVYLPEARFVDHDGEGTGVDAINQKIRDLHARTPGFEFVAGAFHEVGELGTLEWSAGPIGADAVVDGTDVVISRDGRIEALYVYLR